MASLLRAVRCISRAAVPAAHPAVRVAPCRVSIAAIGSDAPAACALPSRIRARFPPIAGSPFARFSGGRAAAAASSSASSSPGLSAHASAHAPIRLALLGDASSRSSLLSALQSRSGAVAATPHPSEFDALWELDSGEEVVARRTRVDLVLDAQQQLQLLDYEDTDEATKAILSSSARRTGRGKKDARAPAAIDGALLVVDAANGTELSASLRILIGMIPRQWPLFVLLNAAATTEGAVDVLSPPPASAASIEALVGSLRGMTNGGTSLSSSSGDAQQSRAVQPVVIRGILVAESEAQVDVSELLRILSATFPVASASSASPQEPFVMAAGSIHNAALAVTPLDSLPLDGAPSTRYTEVSNYPSSLKGRLQLGSVREGHRVELVGRAGARWESVVRRVNAEDDSVTLAGPLEVPTFSAGVHYLVSPPRSLALRSSFEAHLFALAPWEGGRYVPLMQGSRADVRFSAEDLAAAVDLLEPPPELVWGTGSSQVDWLCPGSALTVRLHLTAPTPLRAGMPLTIRQGNQPVAFGIVSRAIDQPLLESLPSMTLYTRASQGVYVVYSIGYRYIGWWLGPILERITPFHEIWMPVGVTLLVWLFMD